ncbi:MAG: THUMP domain-containing protein [Nitrososphaerales archaeon]
MQKFNLLVTTYRHMESEAVTEINFLLAEVGDERPDVSYTGVSGLLTCRTNLDPLEAIERIKKIVQEDPWKVRYVLRLIPVDRVVNTDIQEIKETVKELAERIGAGETFRITVEKRRSGIHSADIIKEVASLIDRKVSLEQQDWLVLIEVVGRETGISVIRPDNIFSAVKVKRELPE